MSVVVTEGMKESLAEAERKLQALYNLARNPIARTALAGVMMHIKEARANAEGRTRDIFNEVRP